MINLNNTGIRNKPKNVNNIFLFLPVLNVLVDLFIFAFSGYGQASIGQRVFLVATQYLLFFIVFMYYKRKFEFKNNDVTIAIKFFLIFTFFRVIFGSDLTTSLNFYVKFAIGYSAFLLGFNIINNIKLMEKLLKVFVLVAGIYFLVIAVLNILKLGISFYGTSRFNAGFAGVESVFSITIILLLTPFVYKFGSKTQKYTVAIVTICVIILFLLILKRTNIIMLVLGAIIYMLLSSNKKYSIFVFSVLTVASILSIFIFRDLFEEAIFSRGDRLTTVDMSREGRSLENLLVYETLSQSATHFIFGTGELFNDVGRYGAGKAWDQSEEIRGLHNDYARIFFGSGLVGLTMLLLIYLLLFKKYLYYRRVNRENIKLFELNNLALALIVVAFTTGLSSGITSISYRTTLMLFLGGLAKVNLLYKSAKT